MWDDLQAELTLLEHRNLLRTLSTVEAVDGPRVRIDGRWGVAWCTNDYLGLSQHPRLAAAAAEAAKQWGVGARASRLLAGSTQVHAELEARVARWCSAEAAVVFASGYLANLGTLCTIAGPDDVILVDRLAHASLIDACRASRALLRVFRHNDVAQVRRLLPRYARARRRVIVTEGLFSMDGDFAPLADLLDAARACRAVVYLDDAHGVFALGASGRGSPERAGVSSDDMIYMGTLGKALGCQGGFIVGPASLIRAVHNRARAFIYATALAVPVAAAACEAVQVLEDDASPRLRLAERVGWLQQQLQSAGLLTARPSSHVVPIFLGVSSRAVRVASRLWEQGIFAPAIRPPTVPEGTARLRLSVSALHTQEQVDQLVAALRDVVSEAP